MRLLAAVLLVLSAMPVVAESDSPLTTVILVRHAEKTADPGPDPPLSEAGQARALELERVLAGTKVDAIYVTQFARTYLTAEPLAKARSLESRALRAGATYAPELAQQIRRDHRGQTVLVVGHSNSTVNLMRELGVTDLPAIPDSQYDDLFICTLAGETVKMIALRYGPVVR